MPRKFSWQFMATSSPGNLARIFDPSPRHSKENGEIYVMSFLQPSQKRKISYREQQELLRIALEEHPEFNKQGMILDTIEKGGKCACNNMTYEIYFLLTILVFTSGLLASIILASLNKVGISLF